MKFKGLKILAYELIATISQGHTETITKVEEELGKNKLVSYLNEKYKEYWMVNFESGPYDINELNNCFTELDGYVQGNESRKYGIVREEDGLLLMLSIIINELQLPK